MRKYKPLRPWAWVRALYWAYRYNNGPARYLRQVGPRKLWQSIKYWYITGDEYDPTTPTA